MAKRDLLEAVAIEIGCLDTLNEMREFGIIDAGGVREYVYKRIQQRIDEVHPSKINQNSKGYWETHYRDNKAKEGRKRVRAKTKEELYLKLYIIYFGEGKTLAKDPDATLASLFDEWKNNKSKKVDPGTITRNEDDWEAYYKGEKIIDIPIRKLDEFYVDDWIHEMIRAHNMTKTQYGNFSLIIRQILQYAVRTKVVSTNVMDNVKPAKRMFRRTPKKTSDEAIFTYEQESELVRMACEDFANEVRWYVLSPLAIIFQFQTGVRIGELLTVKHEDIDGDIIRLRRMLIRDRKIVVDGLKGNHDDRDVELSPYAKKIIEIVCQYKREHGIEPKGYLFTMDEKYLSYHSVESAYEKYCKAIGMRPLKSHSARRTYGSKMYLIHKHVDWITRQLGHEDERTTLRSYCYNYNLPDGMELTYENVLSAGSEYIDQIAETRFGTHLVSHSVPNKQK